jgi:SHS2 domain-containing protein
LNVEPINLGIHFTQITLLSENNLSAKVFYDPYDPDCHSIKIEVKAVTYHQIQVTSGPSGWEARVIFDV